MDQNSALLNTLSAKALAGWEIASILVSCLLAEWIVVSFVGASSWVVLVPVFLALGLILISHRHYRESPREIGFRFDNFLSASRLLLLPTAASILAVLLVVWLAQDGMRLAPLRPKFFLLFFWALFQQYVLQGFVNRRAQTVLGRGLPSILLVGVFFGVLHLPNPALTVLTTFGGLVWAAVYQRHPNLFALALSHYLVSLFAANFLPPHVLNSLRVGFKYFR